MFIKNENDHNACNSNPNTTISNPRNILNKMKISIDMEQISDNYRFSYIISHKYIKLYLQIPPTSIFSA